jgi:hypothetical protein
LKRPFAAGIIEHDALHKNAATGAARDLLNRFATASS